MTSSEIISILRKNEDAKLVNHKLKEILEMADFCEICKDEAITRRQRSCDA